MSRKSPNSLQVVTANRLREGDVVYLTPTGKWSLHLNESWTSEDPKVIDQMLERAQADVAARLIIGPYAMPVAEIDGILQPLSTREAIRAAGPTVRADHRTSAKPSSRAA